MTEGLTGVQQWLVGVWDTALAAFTDHVDAEQRSAREAQAEQQPTRPAQEA